MGNVLLLILHSLLEFNPFQESVLRGPGTGLWLRYRGYAHYAQGPGFDPWSPNESTRQCGQ